MMKGSPESQPIVFVVDDDASLRVALKSLLRSVGLQAQAFGSAPEFLQSKGTESRSDWLLEQAIS